MLQNNLIFDAMRLLPDFKEKHVLQQKQESEIWTAVAEKAITQGEIKTHLTAEIVSKLFINLGDGTNLKLIMENEMSKEKNELKMLWDGLYETLKA